MLPDRLDDGCPPPSTRRRSSAPWCATWPRARRSRVIAARFHGTLAALIAAVCGMVARETGVTTVCLSGGVFQNMVLLKQTWTGWRRPA